jgi:hypothetical protein
MSYTIGKDKIAISPNSFLCLEPLYGLAMTNTPEKTFLPIKSPTCQSTHDEICVKKGDKSQSRPQIASIRAQKEKE